MGIVSELSGASGPWWEKYNPDVVDGIYQIESEHDNIDADIRKDIAQSIIKSENAIDKLDRKILTYAVKPINTTIDKLNTIYTDIQNKLEGDIATISSKYVPPQEHGSEIVFLGETIFPDTLTYSAFPVYHYQASTNPKDFGTWTQQPTPNAVKTTGNLPNFIPQSGTGYYSINSPSTTIPETTGGMPVYPGSVTNPFPSPSPSQPHYQGMPVYRPPGEPNESTLGNDVHILPWEREDRPKVEEPRIGNDVVRLPWEREPKARVDNPPIIPDAKVFVDPGFKVDTGGSTAQPPLPPTTQPPQEKECPPTQVTCPNPVVNVHVPAPVVNVNVKCGDDGNVVVDRDKPEPPLPPVVEPPLPPSPPSPPTVVEPTPIVPTPVVVCDDIDLIPINWNFCQIDNFEKLTEHCERSFRVGPISRELLTYQMGVDIFKKNTTFTDVLEE